MQPPNAVEQIIAIELTLPCRNLKLDTIPRQWGVISCVSVILSVFNMKGLIVLPVVLSTAVAAYAAACALNPPPSSTAVAVRHLALHGLFWPGL